MMLSFRIQHFLSRLTMSDLPAAPISSQSDANQDQEDTHQDPDLLVKTSLIRVEITLVDGNPFSRGFDNEDLKLLWTMGLKKDFADVQGLSSFRLDEYIPTHSPWTPNF